MSKESIQRLKSMLASGLMLGVIAMMMSYKYFSLKEAYKEVCKDKKELCNYINKNHGK